MISSVKKTSVPVFLQSEAAECGLICAAMVAGTFQKGLTPHALKTRHSAPMTGLTLRTMIDILSDTGVTARAINVDIPKLAAIALPAILHWDFTHFVVLERIKGNRYHIVDPAVGRRVLDKDEVDIHYTGIAIEPVRFDPPGATGITPAAGARPLGLVDLLPPLKSLSGPALQILAFTLVLNGAAFVTPLFLKVAVERVFPADAVSILGAAALAFATLAILRAVSTLLRGRALISLRRRLGQFMAASVFEKLVWLSVAAVEKKAAGTIATNYRSTLTLSDSLSEELLGSVIDGLTCVLVLLVITFYAPLIGVALSALCASYTLLMVLTRGKRKSLLRESLVAEGRQGGFFVETINRLLPIRAYQAEAMRNSCFANLLTQAEDTRQVHSGYVNAVNAVGDLITGLGWLAILSLAAYQVVGGTMTVGTFAAIAVWVGLTVNATKSAVSRLVQIDALEMHVDRIADIVCGQSDRPANVVPRALPGGGGQLRSIGCREVSFRYGSGQPLVLADCSLTVEKGRWVVVRGPSGIGKSTLIRIVTGLLEPASGSVLCNGEPLAFGDVPSLRRRFGVVLQNDGLFGGSIRDNVSFFDPSADTERVRHCLELSGLADDIDRLPMKLDSIVGEQGAGLSAGQIQRLLLSRALYRRPDFLILDEFSANLDQASEAMIINGLKAEGIGVLSVAHRTSLMAAADTLLELSDGRLHDVTPPAASVSLQRTAPGDDYANGQAKEVDRGITVAP